MRYILILITTALLFSCSSTHEIKIKKDRSATFNFNVQNKESLIDTIKEWGYIDSEQSEIIDTAELIDEFNKNEFINNLSIKSNEDSQYRGSFTVSDINKVFNDNILSLTEKDNNNVLRIFLTADNYKYIKDAIPTLNEESIEMLGPDANQDLSKEEYLDMISFSLGDQGPEDLKSSIVNLRITVDGDITENIGGELIDNKTIEFEIPLLDLILLKRNIEYIIIYK